MAGRTQVGVAQMSCLMISRCMHACECGERAQQLFCDECTNGRCPRLVRALADEGAAIAQLTATASTPEDWAQVRGHADALIEAAVSLVRLSQSF